MTITLVFASFLLLLLALVIRVVIFNTMDSDPEARELLDDHFPVQADILFLTLWRLRKKVEPHHERKVVMYFWLNVAAAVSLAAAIVLDRAS